MNRLLERAILELKMRKAMGAPPIVAERETPDAAVVDSATSGKGKKPPRPAPAPTLSGPDPVAFLPNPNALTDDPVDLYGHLLPETFDGDLLHHAARGLRSLGSVDTAQAQKTLQTLLNHYASGKGDVKGQFAHLAFPTGHAPVDKPILDRGSLDTAAWKVAEQDNPDDPSVARKNYLEAVKAQKLAAQAAQQAQGLPADDREDGEGAAVADDAGLEPTNEYEADMAADRQEAREDPYAGGEMPEAFHHARYAVGMGEFQRADRLFEQFPNPAADVDEWQKWAVNVFGPHVVPAPPFQLIRYVNAPEQAGIRMAAHMNAPMLQGVEQGMELTRRIAGLYQEQKRHIKAYATDHTRIHNARLQIAYALAGRRPPEGESLPAPPPDVIAAAQDDLSRQHAKELTAKMFAWGFLSRGASPFPHEASYLDMAQHEDQHEDQHESHDAMMQGARRDLEYFFGKAVDGSYDPNEYGHWAASLYAEHGSPGQNVTHNINAIGHTFLPAMNRRGADGKTNLQWLHERIRDEASGAKIRREYIARVRGSGIDNKVASFVLLLAGKPDVMVLDRVQIRNMWGEGEDWKNINLYEKGKSLPGATRGIRGTLVYEAFERALSMPGQDGKTPIQRMYRAMGLPDADRRATPAHFHWLSWNIAGEMEVNHGSLESIIAEAAHANRMRERGEEPDADNREPDLFVNKTVREGRLENIRHGAEFGTRRINGRPRRDAVTYTAPDGQTYWFSYPRFKDLMERIRKPLSKNKARERGLGAGPDPVVQPLARGQKSPYMWQLGETLIDRESNGKTHLEMPRDENGKKRPWHELPGFDRDALSALVRRVAEEGSEHGESGVWGRRRGQRGQPHRAGGGQPVRKSVQPSLAVLWRIHD